MDENQNTICFKRIRWISHLPSLPNKSRRATIRTASAGSPHCYQRPNCAKANIESSGRHLASGVGARLVNDFPQAVDLREREKVNAGQATPNAIILDERGRS